MDQKTYNSDLTQDYIEITAPYYNAINDTTVFFAQEKVSVSMNALGHIHFYDDKEASLGFVDIPVSKDPSDYAHSAQYGQIRCASDGKEITIFLPSYWWSDSYPDCDGEYDRWTRHIDHWFRIIFDCETQNISMVDNN